MKATVLAASLFLLAAFAAFISHHLTVKHIAGTSGASWFEAGCSDSPEQGAANCAAVLASPYAYFPAKHDNAAGGIHFPVAFLGLIYYTTIALWAIGIGVPSRSRVWLHGVLTALVAMGLVSSAYFVYLMFAKMGQWCPWCAVTHGANLLIFVCILLMWPLARRRPTATAAAAADSPAGSARRSSSADAPAAFSIARPTTRAIILTFIAIVGFNDSHWNMLGMKVWRRTAERSQSDFAICRNTLSKSLLMTWQQQPGVSIAARPDDPVRTLGAGAGEPLEVVIFSDFECPSCQRFAARFEQLYAPLFSQPVRLTFRHFPLDQACNQFASKTLHAHACQAGRWAEAARLLGGNEAFWRAHDFLFQHREDLAAGRLSTAQLAQALGLDAAALEGRAQSIEVTNRIAENIAAARAVNVIGTPAVFVQGKPIDQIAKGELPFWQGLAEILARRGQTSSEGRDEK